MSNGNRAADAVLERPPSTDDHCAAEWNAIYANRVVGQGKHRRGKPAAEFEPCRRVTLRSTSRWRVGSIDTAYVVTGAHHSSRTGRCVPMFYSRMHSGSTTRRCFKNFFALPGESVLSFRAEFFNLPNTNSFNAPSSTIDASTCCTVAGTDPIVPIFNLPPEVQLLTNKRPTTYAQVRPKP